MVAVGRIYILVLCNMLGRCSSSFNCFKVLGIERERVQISYTTFDVIFKLLGPKNTNNVTFLPKLLPVN